jgi:hypothetical protein
MQSLRATWLLAATTTIIAAQRYAGSMLIVIALPLVPWLLYSGYVLARKPSMRAIQSRKVAIWLVSIATIVFVHSFRDSTARDYAQGVVNSLQAYSDQHGSYPSSLEAVGVTEKNLKSELGLAGYTLDRGQPGFYYASTFGPFAFERYDFERRDWKHVLH